MTTPQDRVRAALAAYAVSVQPRPPRSLIRDRIRKTAAPDAPGTAAEAEPLGGTTAMTTVSKKPLTLEIGDVIATVPATGERCERILTAPPVRFADDVELEYREHGRAGRMVVDRRTPMVVDTTHRERRLHAMTSGEEHMAMRWLHDHDPAAFDRAADYVDQIRRLDASGVRKEATR